MSTAIRGCRIERCGGAHISRERAKNGLHLKHRQLRMLAENARDQPGNVGSREAVAGGGDPPSVLPWDRDFDPGRAELHRRIRIVVKAGRAWLAVRGDG